MSSFVVRSFISVALLTQLTVGNLAQAQVVTGGDANPFWSNGTGGGATGIPKTNTVNPNDPNSWWNDPGTSNGDNPFNWDDPATGWNNSGPMTGGGWGDPSLDPTGIYGNWSGGYSMNVRPTNSWWSNVMRYSLALNKDFVGEVNDLRKKNKPAPGQNPDDALADLIIAKNSHIAGLLGAGAALIPPALDYVWKEWRGNSGSFGYGVGIGIGGGIDFMSIVRVQTNMMLSLAEVYGELPNDEDERADMATIPFVLGLGGGAANKLLANHLLLSTAGGSVTPVTPPIIPPEPVVPVIPPVAPVTPAVVTAADANTVANAVATKADINGILGKFFNDAKAADNFIVHMPAIVKVVASAGLAWGLNEASTRKFGGWAKRYFKALYKVRLGNTIHAVRSRPEAKGLIYLLLAKDIFNSLTIEDAKTFTAIINHEMPLIHNAKWDEHKDLFEAYKENSKIIDEYMRVLRRDLDIHAKLYIVRLVLGAMLMKGGTNPHDLQTLETLGVGLGLVPPPRVNTDSLKPGDVRVENMLRYQAAIERMEQAVNVEEIARASKKTSKAEKVAPNLKRWPRAGRIILEEYEDSDVQPVVDLQNDIQRKGGVGGNDVKKAQNIASGALDNPPTTPPATQAPATQAPAAAKGGDPHERYVPKSPNH